MSINFWNQSFLSKIDDQKIMNFAEFSRCLYRYRFLFSYQGLVSFVLAYYEQFLLEINAFHANGLLLYLLKTSENLRFSDVFKGYQKRPVAWNRFKKSLTGKQTKVIKGIINNGDFLEIPIIEFEYDCFVASESLFT